MLAVPLAAMVASAAQPQGASWKIAERIEVEQVPSGFPVGFSLLTHGNRQYAAYYDAAHQMTVATRLLGERKWQTQKLDSKVGWDSHNYITMAVDTAGALHLAGNMHCVPLIYFRTEKPGDITTLKRLPMTGQQEARCTYPIFLRDAAGRLVFQYRDGGSGNGSQLFNVYDAAAKTWSRMLQTPLFDGEGQRNAYLQGPVVGPDRLFHLAWVWRDTPDCATNHDLSYARSRDLVHWETAAGQPLKTPMTLKTAGVIVDPVPAGGGMINGGQKLVFDTKKRPLIAYHKNDAAGNMQVYVARFEGGQWNRQVLTTWTKPVEFSGGGSMPFIGIAVSPPQRLGDGGWSVRYRHRDYGSGVVTFSDATLRPEPVKATKQQPEYPAELSRPELVFDQIGVQQAGDRGDSGDPAVRYVMAWETLPANRDRQRTGPLPPAATLRVIKLVRGE
jgi:hypothetical protein